MAETAFLAGGNPQWITTFTYDGLSTKVTPPSGGTPTTTVTDAQGRRRELRQHGNPDASTEYTYTKAGQLASVIGPDDATWSYTYDLAGNTITAVDPDKGTTHQVFNAVGQLTATTDAEDLTLIHKYDDPLGRRTSIIRDGASTPEAEWTYDTATNGKGQLASATSWQNGQAYLQTITKYAYATGLPANATLTIPQSEGALAGTYQSSISYEPDGQIASEWRPAVGGLASEYVGHSYADTGQMVSTRGGLTGRGDNDLVTDTQYTRYGELQRLQLGTTDKRVWLSAYYDTNSRRLNRTVIDVETANPMQADLRYSYNDIGDIISIGDVPEGKPGELQCFGRDGLRRLTAAWTPTGDCTTDPVTGALGGPAAYAQTFRYDQAGNRLGEIRRTLSGLDERTFTYGNTDGSQPHVLRTAQRKSQSTPDTWQHDDNGSMTERPGGHAMIWDSLGRLASDAGSQFVYDVGGSRLIRRDANSTTLYLPGQEVRLDKNTNAVTATRYYTHGSAMVAMRTTGNLTWLVSDHQGTAEMSVDSVTLQISRRRQDPFGMPRGDSPASVAGEHGFVGGVNDANGLVHLGAREYDASLGRFISVDPVMDTADPQQMQGYAYANNNPVTFSDPTGLLCTNGPDGSCRPPEGGTSSTPTVATPGVSDRQDVTTDTPNAPAENTWEHHSPSVCGPDGIYCNRSPTHTPWGHERCHKALSATCQRDADLVTGPNGDTRIVLLPWSHEKTDDEMEAGCEYSAACRASRPVARFLEKQSHISARKRFNGSVRGSIYGGEVGASGGAAVGCAVGGVGGDPGCAAGAAGGMGFGGLIGLAIGGVAGFIVGSDEFPSW